MMPSTKIMVIRHAEVANGEPGAMPDGSPNPDALSATGWRRAEGLVGLFAPPDGQFRNPHLATPQHIFASGVAAQGRSLRPQQTVAPLAATLRLPIDTRYAKGDEAALAQAATTLGGILLIACEREAIPAIAQAILGSGGNAPRRWPGSRYDMVWLFVLPEGTRIWRFIQVPQRLLPDDLSEPIVPA
jgi:hypothetical protein